MFGKRRAVGSGREPKCGKKEGLCDSEIEGKMKRTKRLLTKSLASSSKPSGKE